ncbi:MAG: quinol:electron acceptor oxidoreductase subunit ActD [Terriglobales bacterium]
MKNTAAFGVYRTQREVEYAIDLLRAEGFHDVDISVLFPANQKAKDLSVEKNSIAPRGTAAGATTGAVVGGTLGWLAGIGALAIPGVGALIATGPIVAVLAGVSVGGALGGLAGALIGMGIPESEAKRYERRIQEGGILVSVRCDNADWTKKAKAILENRGATDISSADEARPDWQTTEEPIRRAS